MRSEILIVSEPGKRFAAKKNLKLQKFETKSEIK